jgi:sulfate adenylyltransferase subunit 1 (EFTu-like GTPase family)
VDDGKSTLIGRLLYDTQSVYEDQVRSIEGKGTTAPGQIDFALLTDGLRAEREQGITIDVAYRYFSTRGASSSSRIRRATSSTRATWPPARRRPMRRWC